MQRTLRSKTIGWLAAAMGILAGLLLVGASTASADFVKPVILSPSALGGNVSLFPNCIPVNWYHPGSGVVGFSVEREDPAWGRDDIGADQRSYLVCGMEPSTWYRFQVCAYFGTEDGDSECSDWVDLRTAAPETSPAPPPPPPPPAPALPPAPVLTATARSASEVYLKWEFPGYQARLTSAKLYRDGAAIYEALRPGNFDSDHVDAVQPNSTHRYHMCFRNPDGETCSAPITASPTPSSRPPGGTLTPPRNVQETQSRDGVTLTWELGTGATSYQVRCTDISGGGRCGLTYSNAGGDMGLDNAPLSGRQNLWEVTSYTFKDLFHPNYYVVRVCSLRTGEYGRTPETTACAPEMVIWPRPFGTVDYGGTPGPGPNGCYGGKVWRWAFEGDHVCVEPARVYEVIADNAEAAARREPNGGPYGPDTCKQGYVWREAFEGDTVCVTPEERGQVAAENATPGGR